MSCEGCKLEAIRNRTQVTIIHEQAKQYANENKVQTVVYFDGQGWQFATEQFARQSGYANITAFYSPQNQ